MVETRRRKTTRLALSVTGTAAPIIAPHIIQRVLIVNRCSAEPLILYPLAHRSPTDGIQICLDSDR